MQKADRQQAIIQFLLKNDGKASVNELIQFCQVTKETIRKDLIEMENNQQLRRVLGGAVIQPADREISIDSRTQEHADLKREIAAAARDFISEGEFIAVDSGSTNYFLAMELEMKNLTVLTNSVNISNGLSHKSGFRIFLTGGELRTKNMSVTGSITENTISQYIVNKAFLTASGVDLQFGIMDAYEPESRVKRAFMRAARECYLLVDHTKFHHITPINVSDFEHISAIITDSRIDKNIVEEYRAHGIRIIAANPAE